MDIMSIFFKKSIKSLLLLFFDMEQEQEQCQANAIAKASFEQLTKASVVLSQLKNAEEGDLKLAMSSVGMTGQQVSQLEALLKIIAQSDVMKMKLEKEKEKEKKGSGEGKSEKERKKKQSSSVTEFQTFYLNIYEQAKTKKDEIVRSGQKEEVVMIRSDLILDYSDHAHITQSWAPIVKELNALSTNSSAYQRLSLMHFAREGRLYLDLYKLCCQEHHESKIVGARSKAWESFLNELRSSGHHLDSSRMAFRKMEVCKLLNEFPVLKLCGVSGTDLAKFSGTFRQYLIENSDVRHFWMTDVHKGLPTRFNFAELRNQEFVTCNFTTLSNAPSTLAGVPDDKIESTMNEHRKHFLDSVEDEAPKKRKKTDKKKSAIDEIDDALDHMDVGGDCGLFGSDDDLGDIDDDEI
jgi:hypothetical protein